MNKHDTIIRDAATKYDLESSMRLSSLTRRLQSYAAGAYALDKSSLGAALQQAANAITALRLENWRLQDELKDRH